MLTRDPITDTFVGIQDVLPILDKSGLAGRYYIAFDIGTHEDWPSALEHQLGLKLDWRMVPTEIIVIDNAAKPSGN